MPAEQIRRRVCVVTGSRADYGLLRWVIDALHNSDGFDLQLVVTGMHLTPDFGHTVDAVEDDGYPIAARVEMLLASDTPVAIAKSMALGLSGFADTLARLRPDLLLVLGDRFEILAAAAAALVANVPIAHIAGGDITEGSFDDAIRHSLTKMAHVHFATNAASGNRILQMGEEPWRVHVVGSPGIDTIRRTCLLDRASLEAELGTEFQPRNLLVTFHPVTLTPETSASEVQTLLDALDTLGDGYGLYFTMPNADPTGRSMAATVRDFVTSRPHAAAFTSLGQLRYLSLLDAADVVVGNSSSGLYEAPTLRTPTVNIGNRQSGRSKADSVVDCPPERAAIVSAIHAALDLDTSQTVNPYGDGHASERIIDAIGQLPARARLLHKRFHAVPEVSV